VIFEVRHKLALEVVNENGEAVAFVDCFVAHLMDASEAAMGGAAIGV